MPKRHTALYESLFAPKITSREGVIMDKTGSANTTEDRAKIFALYEKWQSESEAIEINPGKYPAALIQSLVFANLLSEKSISDEMVEEFTHLPGSSNIGGTRDSIILNFAEATLGGDDRINMQFIRSAVPKARQLTKQMVESGDDKAIIETLRHAVDLYAASVSDYEGSSQMHWHENVYRFDELVKAIDEMGIDHESVGLSELVMNRLQIGKIMSDAWAERSQLRDGLPKPDELEGEDKEKLIRAEAINAIQRKLVNDHRSITYAYSVAAEVSGDPAEFAAMSGRKFTEAPLTEFEKHLLKKGAEGIIHEFDPMVREAFEGKKVTASSDISLEVSSASYSGKKLRLKDATSTPINPASLWDAMKGLEPIYSQTEGVQNEIDWRIQKVRSMVSEFNADPSGVTYDKVLELRANVDRLYTYGNLWSSALKQLSPFQENLPKGVTFDDYGRIYFKGKNPMALSMLGITVPTIDSLNPADFKNPIPERSYKEFMQDMDELGKAFIADTASYSKNSAEYLDLCDTVKKFVESKGRHSVQDIERLANRALAYEEHVGDKPKNARQARRLELCHKIINSCMDMRVAGRLTTAFQIDKDRELEAEKKAQELREQQAKAKAEMEERAKAPLNPEMDAQSLMKELSSSRASDLSRGVKVEFITSTNIPDEVKLSNDVELLRSYMDSGRLSQREMDYLSGRITVQSKIEGLRANPKKVMPSPVVQMENGTIFMSDIHQTRKQTTGNGCYSCAMKLLLQSRGLDLEQEEIRAYMPDGTTKNSIVAESALGDRMGNPIDRFDLIAKTLPNTAMVEEAFDTTYATSADKKLVCEQARAVVMKALLDHHSPIALLHGAHYRTIVGYNPDTDTLILKDSNSYTRGADFNHEVKLSSLVDGKKLGFTYLVDLDPEKPMVGLEGVHGLEYVDGEYKVSEDMVFDNDEDLPTDSVAKSFSHFGEVGMSAFHQINAAVPKSVDRNLHKDGTPLTEEEKQARDDKARVEEETQAAKKLLAEKRRGILDQIDSMMGEIVPEGSKFTITKVGKSDYRVSQSYTMPDESTVKKDGMQPDVLGKYIFLDTIRKNITKLTPWQLDHALEPSNVEKYASINAGSEYLKKALDAMALDKGEFDMDKIVDCYGANRFIDSNMEAWKALPDKALIELRQEYRAKIDVDQPSERDLQTFYKLTDMMAERNIATSIQHAPKEAEKTEGEKAAEASETVLS